MRNAIIATGLGVALIGLLFLAADLTPHLSPAQRVAQSAAQIQKGFVGVRPVGVWKVACLASPTIVGGTPKPSPAKPVSLGRCRTTLEIAVRNRPRQPFLILSFRPVGANKALTAIIVFPPAAKKGDAVLLGLGRNRMLKLPVRGCSKEGCVAMAELGAAARTAILSAPGSVLVLPAASPGGRRPSIRIPFFGLPAAIAAMLRAEG
ncbi:MAG: invasion associated locus B family protein [Rhizomicrobium sp.]